MNDKAAELILALSEEGKTMTLSLNNSSTPNIRLKKDEAVSLVAKTLKKNETDASVFEHAYKSRRYTVCRC